MSDHVPPRPTVLAPGVVHKLETPTEQAVKEAPKKIVQVIDERSRILTVKFLSPLDRMRLYKILGKDSGNEMYMGYAALAFAVCKIDDEDVSTNTVREIEFMVERLGEEGLEAVGKCYETDFAAFLKINKDAAKN